MSDEIKRAVDKAVNDMTPWHWPFQRINSGGDKEWACRHGVGHGGMHGCDGCCSDPAFPGHKPDECKSRLSDSDLKSCLEYNPQELFKEQDILHVHAAVMGANDEDAWYWIIQCTGDRFFLVKGSCDYTGWDCQSGASSWEYKTSRLAAEAANSKRDYDNREVTGSLIAQLEGRQPFGTMIYDHRPKK